MSGLGQMMEGVRHGDGESHPKQIQNSHLKERFASVGDFMKEIVPNFPNLTFVVASTGKPS